MRFYPIQPTFYGGIDLHVDWMYLCVLDTEGEVRVHQNLPTAPNAVLQARQPFREDVVVGGEGLFTWDWLADLCEDEGMPFVLGHALSMRAIHGGNAQNDRIDAPKIAALLRGGLLPQASVYPRRMRATRDLLRRSNHLLHQRAELDAHIQHTASQDNLGAPLGRIAKPHNRRHLLERFDHAWVQKTMAVALALVDGDEPRLAEWARYSEQTAQGHDPVALALLRTSPGVGNILALGRLSEIAAIARFPRVPAFVSSCRLVKRARASNGQRHGPSGKKLGTAPLTWAFSAAAVLFLKTNAPAHKYLATLATRHGKGKALSILAHNLGQAVYFMLKQHVAFDQAQFRATEGWRARTSLAAHGRPRGQRPATRIAPSDHARGP